MGIPFNIKAYVFVGHCIMDYEHELDVVEMQKWLANFDDPEIMRVARTFLDFVYQLPDDYEVNEYSEFTFF